MKKPRSDSKLDALTVDQQRQLCDWLLSGLSYKVVKKLVHEEFAVDTSSAALSSFYQDYCGAELIRRRKLAVTVSQQVATEAAKLPGQFDAAAIDLLQQKAFELASAPQADPKSVQQIFGLVLKARDQSLKESQIALALRRVELLEANAAAAKQKLEALTTNKGGISPETLTAIEEAARLL